MLPSSAAESGQPHVLIYLITSDSANLNHLCTNLGGQVSATDPILMTFPAKPEMVVVIHSQSQIDTRIVETCDALVVVLDGSSGVGSETIKLWQQARDQSLPRHFLATNIVHGRADFDELGIIATRTMEPDLMIRYLPIDSDDESSLDGIYDLLTSEIQTGTKHNWVIKSADPEHIAITSTAREDLFDRLAYLGLDDATLENHRLGLPISIPKLESAWLHPDVVSITPIDFEIGKQVFADWISRLSPVWNPSVVQNENTSDVSHANERLGIALTEKIARMWGEPSEQDLVMAFNGSQSSLEILYESEPLMIAKNLKPGATICVSSSSSVLLAPTF